MATAALVDIGSLVTQTPGVYGGRPCLAGTRFPIVQLAAYYAEGLTPEAIVARHGESLGLAAVYAGLAYYLANRCAIDAEIEEEDRAYMESAREARRESAVNQPLG